jgi:Flp pilus assembly protein TadD
MTYFDRAMRINDDDKVLLRNFGKALAEDHQLPAALKVYRHLIELSPDNATDRVRLADVYGELNQPAEAIDQFRQALDLDPDLISALNNLAFLLATTPYDTRRDGRQAVELATRAVQLTGEKDPIPLDTLAAAYAETGRFDDAVATIGKALALTTDPERQERMTDRLKLYRAHKTLAGEGIENSK